MFIYVEQIEIWAKFFDEKMFKIFWIKKIDSATIKDYIDRMKLGH